MDELQYRYQLHFSKWVFRHGYTLNPLTLLRLG